MKRVRGTRIVPLVTLCLMMLWPGACGPDPNADSRSEGEPALISLVPSVTEILYELGVGEQLVGNTSYCDWPEPARRVTKVGSFYQPDIEKIAALRPEMVFIALPVHRPVQQKLAELGIPTYASDPQDLAGLFAEIESLGRLTGRVRQAEEMAQAMRAEIAALDAPSDTPRVYVEISDKPLMTAGKGSFLDELIKLAGGRNIFGDIERAYPTINPEDVVRLDPEVVLLAHPGSTPAELRARLGWSEVTAIRDGRVYADIDENLLVRPGPRVVEGIRELRERLACQPPERNHGR